MDFETPHRASAHVPDRIDIGTPAGDAGQGACASNETLRDAAVQAGKSEILDRYAADYPKGPA